MTTKKNSIAKRNVAKSKHTLDEKLDSGSSQDQSTEKRSTKTKKGDLPATSVDFPIVGIGASAGGLSAYEAFFSGMPADIDPDMAFVLVPHLAPDHKSYLRDLIQRLTRMQVFEAEDGVTVKPNCVYIIPPNRDMAFMKGKLQLLKPVSPHGQRLPIDFFFRSLAQDRREKAICVVLSGTGRDGMMGAREVKGEGGMVMAQQPESAEYDGMPCSAIATGLVDYILPPAEMPEQLILYASHFFHNRTRSFVPLSSRGGDVFNKIFVLLRDQTGHDFSEYKENTIFRRVERRMVVHQIERIDEYIQYLQCNPVETQALFCDLLIGVTSFFRDPDSFAVLASHIRSQFFTHNPTAVTIRVWVPACSTGEEAYSIAILLHEQMDALHQHFKVQIFATDIDSHAIEMARLGTYPVSIARDISAERLAKFFTLQADGNTYRINKGIRDMLVFSEQDVIRDPPFSKLDLVSCRNLLIYMSSALQKKLIALFHYALNSGGLLFLGTSESVGDLRGLFISLDRKAKLYQSKDSALGEQRHALRKFIKPMMGGEVAPQDIGPAYSGRRLTRRELVERVLLQHYTPASILVNKAGEILYVHGRTGRYLEMAAGDIGVNVLKMAREGLRRDLTTALHTAITQQEPVSRSGLRVKTNGDFSVVNLTVTPVVLGFEESSTSAPLSQGNLSVSGEPGVSEFRARREVSTDPFLYLIIVEEVGEVDEAPAGKVSLGDLAEAAEMSPDAQALISSLRQELRAKEEYLQSATEELEASGEEMQSVNEELQSSNEELETSKEELQSINEELTTVNTELHNKVVDLLRSNNDLNNLLAGTGVGTIFVDQKMLIQRFTPAVCLLVNLIPSDVGRPVGHTVTNLVNYTNLEEDVKAVLDSLVPRDIEVKSKSGAWFLMSIRPYRTLENVAEGAVINFVEITKMVDAQESLRRLAVVVNDSHDAITMQDLAGRILAWNSAAQRMYGWTEAEALAMNIRELIPESLRDEAMEKVQQLICAEKILPYTTQRLTKDGQNRTVSITATALLDKDGKVYAIATTERSQGLEIQRRG